MADGWEWWAPMAARVEFGSRAARMGVQQSVHSSYREQKLPPAQMGVCLGLLQLHTDPGFPTVDPVPARKPDGSRGQLHNSLRW